MARSLGLWPLFYPASLSPETRLSVITRDEITERAPGKLGAYPDFCLQLALWI